VLEDEPAEAAVVEEEAAEIVAAEEAPAPRPKRRKTAGLAKLLMLIAGAALAFVLLLTCAGTWWSFHLESFDDAPRAFRPGTAVRLRQLDSVIAPCQPEQVVYAHKHQRLFLRTRQEVWVVDAATGKADGPFRAKSNFIDFSLSPFEDALFVADEAAHPGDTSENEQWVHRYDLAGKSWQTHTTPTVQETVYETKRINDQLMKKRAVGTKNTYVVVSPLKAVSGSRLLMMQGGNNWGNLTLNRWGSGDSMRQQAKADRFDNEGSFAYDPRSGRLFYVSTDPKRPPIGAKRVAGSWLRDATPSVKAEQQGWRGKVDGPNKKVILSTNGRRLYVGQLQFDPDDLNKPLREFPDLITLASDDLAFGGFERTYYDAETAQEAGKLPAGSVAVAVSQDGSRLWANDFDARKLHLFAIEGEK
jgi:hypothetical protein